MSDQKSDALPVHEYQPGTWGPEEVGPGVSPAGGWHNPTGKPQ
jgi:glucose-6-phosphate 1-dehydrogenase